MTQQNNPDSANDQRREQQLRADALDYHRHPTRGKIEVVPTKPLSNQRDLSLAYSPGVAYACEEIAANPATAAEYTSRGNLVAVITNGTAVLGLGNIGPLASKPVMEGKGCLFKQFAGVDVFDIELAETDPDKLVDAIAMLEPTVGGINLEDIKAPECFYIEQKLRERMNIPVFHDDQHGTAIISSAALLNALKVAGKRIGDIKLVASGAGAAAIACLDMMVGLGVRRENVYVADSRGVIWQGREANMEANKARYAQATDARTLADIVRGADVFLGCSTAGVLTGPMVQTMAERPIILALANPEPEIRPEVALAARPDCIIATGRSDYPNQVNNVLCFPYIFRGALDCGATRITEAMKQACVVAIAALAEAEVSETVAAAYAGQALSFGPDYIIPKPFDQRLMAAIAPAVAQAAAESGVATQPIADLAAYRAQLEQQVYHTGLVMKPLFSSAKAAPKRVVYAEGDEERVLRAVQTVVDEGLAQPVLVGAPAAVEQAIAAAGLRLKRGTDYVLADPGTNDATAHALALLQSGDADAVLCGVRGNFDRHLEQVRDIIGLAPDAEVMATMNALVLEKHTLFVADTHVNDEPDARQLAAIAQLAAREVRNFGLEPKVALLSHSTAGASERPSARKMREAHALLTQAAPDLPVLGEVQGDVALMGDPRGLAAGGFAGEANVLVMPSLDAANIAFNLLKVTGGKGVTVGPVLLGAAKPVHVLGPGATVRRIVNMTAVAVAEAIR
ncbi:malate dehydrogenase (oxaloacetate-decarboxylating)(NADP+) [Pseudoduganella flava]|uniref:Malate dehydrogenase (Oxaloacetate-decarboxylating)(NADP+) n=1 Tax=Pseudoduganella flava TaxID=871742 RepID=A0A562PCY6_9BURK|nr:NADP-dependent malic enzyme [Pseudoduganella flava]QGZ38019.1 NADP-dependent malic enzyme [Pseudoduganella flava]TWI41846.1 malate dehydrogenase (oxaloacetate-decarboxylating)(NADP+) [Pseudoduganella flava]